MQYEFKAGSQITGVKAGTAGRYLDRLRTRSGGDLTPRMVVDAARPENAMLHPYFEWNNRAAAEKYRLAQAGHLIRCIVIVEGEGEDAETTRAFHYVRRSGESQKVYVHMREVFDEDELKAQVLEDARRELIGWKTRYAQYREVKERFASVFEAIGAVAD